MRGEGKEGDGREGKRRKNRTKMSRFWNFGDSRRHACHWPRPNLACENELMVNYFMPNFILTDLYCHIKQHITRQILPILGTISNGQIFDIQPSFFVKWVWSWHRCQLWRVDHQPLYKANFSYFCIQKQDQICHAKTHGLCYHAEIYLVPHFVQMKQKKYHHYST